MRLNNNVSKYILGIALLFIFNGISRSVQTSAPESVLQGMIARQLQSVYPSGQFRYSVTIKWVPEQFHDLEASQIHNVIYRGAGNPISYCMYQVSYDIGGLVKTANIQAFIKVEELLPVAVHRLESGRELQKEDVAWTLTDITKMTGKPVDQQSEMEGLVLSRIVNKGSILKWTDLRRKPVMMPGDEVTLIYNFKGIKIDMHCVARQSGAIGDRVRLYSRETGKTYVGKVIGAATAIWKGTL